MVLERLDDVVLAVQVLLEQRLIFDARHQVLLADQRQTDVLHELGQVLSAIVRIELDPGDDRLVHLLLGRHGQVVALDEAGDLLVLQVEELVVLDDLTGCGWGKVLAAY